MFKVNVGDVVKVAFRLPFSVLARTTLFGKGAKFRGENVWVRVTHVDGNKIKGILDSYPVIIDHVYGDEVEFTRDMVTSVFEE